VAAAIAFRRRAAALLVPPVGSPARRAPHRPDRTGKCCPFCRNFYAWEQLGVHIEGGCYALECR
jgi:hypothetical protein